MTHLVKQNSVTQVQVRRGWVKSSLDPEWTIQSKLLRELLFHKELAAAALDDLQLFRYLPGHSGALGVLPMVIRRKTPIDQFVEYSVDIIHATVLVIKVVGMLPHVDGQ